jgi:hypothetical protein
LKGAHPEPLGRKTVAKKLPLHAGREKTRRSIADEGKSGEENEGSFQDKMKAQQ